MATIDDFNTVEIKIGKIISAEKIPETDKLLRLMVDFGLKPSTFHAEGLPDHSPQTDGLREEQDIRQVVSGIAPYFEDPLALVGVFCAFVTNLEPRVIKGFESQAMILGVKTKESFSLLTPSRDVLPGSKAG